MTGLVETAKMMMSRHGLRAAAVAAERAEEMRCSGDAAGFARWEQIQAAIQEMRRARPAQEMRAQ